MKTSVALCTFNGEKFLQEQLSSILLQSVSVNEIVVCDDGSTDQTFEILKNYQGKFPKLFRIYRNEKNLGYVLNFEKAMSLCSGEIIFLCDQDDVWDKDKVERTVQFFSEHQEVDLVAHNLKLLDASEKDTTFWDLKNFDSEKTNLSSEKLLEQILLNGNIFPGMSLAIRKSFLKK
jgi:Glycosyltransferases involved in cell wall biogenesis